MKSPLALALCSVFLLLSGTPTLVTGNAEDNELLRLQEEVFNWQLQRNPLLGSALGKKSYDHLLNNFAIPYFAIENSQALVYHRRTEGIQRDRLSNDSLRYTYDVLRKTLDSFYYNYIWRFHGAANPINYVERSWDIFFYLHLISLDGANDFRNYVKRLKAWPTLIAQLKQRMNASAVRYRTANHNVSMTGVPDGISRWTDQNLNEITLYTRFNEALNKSSISENLKGKLRSGAVTALQRVQTVLGDLKDFIVNIYLPNTRVNYGVCNLPDGERFYRACLNWYLSVDMDPRKVHQMGRWEIGNITRLVRQIMKKQKFRGNVKQFFNTLKADPQLSLNSSAQICDRYKAIINQAFLKLYDVFYYIPPRNLQVEKMKGDRGVAALYHHGSLDGSKPATLYVNVGKPNQTKTYDMIPVALHYAIPGYHLQQSMQLYQLKLPNFRQYATSFYWFVAPYDFDSYEAYREGWSAYAVSLGEEMGLYTDDYKKIGWYAADLLQACRLVVDTGIHYYNWTRERAIRYMERYTVLPLTNVEREVDRYITWPGQACAYKIGEMKFKELRKRAETELGNEYDIRDFHQTVLDCGPVPLSVLDTIVNDYITRTKRAVG